MDKGIVFHSVMLQDKDKIEVATVRDSKVLVSWIKGKDVQLSIAGDKEDVEAIVTAVLMYSFVPFKRHTTHIDMNSQPFEVIEINQHFTGELNRLRQRDLIEHKHKQNEYYDKLSEILKHLEEKVD